VFERRTSIVQGALAFGMRRWRAAQANECGVQILTLPQLAACLAGGFLRPALDAEIEPAIQEALKTGGFQDLEAVRHLPGMTRAVLRTWLHARCWGAWHAARRATAAAAILAQGPRR
jgi:hypothetical protein